MMRTSMEEEVREFTVRIRGLTAAAKETMTQQEYIEMLEMSVEKALETIEAIAGVVDANT